MDCFFQITFIENENTVTYWKKGCFLKKKKKSWARTNALRAGKAVSSSSKWRQHSIVTISLAADWKPKEYWTRVQLSHDVAQKTTCQQCYQIQLSSGFLSCSYNCVLLFVLSLSIQLHCHYTKLLSEQDHVVFMAFYLILYFHSLSNNPSEHSLTVRLCLVWKETESELLL